MQNQEQPSIYWHDYETWGATPQKDRPSQFAGIRTDFDLNIIANNLSSLEFLDPRPVLRFDGRCLRFYLF